MRVSREIIYLFIVFASHDDTAIRVLQQYLYLRRLRGDRFVTCVLFRPKALTDCLATGTPTKSITRLEEASLRPLCTRRAHTVSPQINLSLDFSSAYKYITARGRPRRYVHNRCAATAAARVSTDRDSLFVVLLLQ